MFYWTATRSALLCGTKCWALKSHHANKMCNIDANISSNVRKTGNIRRDEVRNGDIVAKVGAIPYKKRCKKTIYDSWITCHIDLRNQLVR